MINEELNIRKKRSNGIIAIIFLISSFYPIAFDTSFTKFSAMELFTPILFGFLLVDMVLKKKALFHSSNSIYYVAILVLLLWAIISWFRFPIFVSDYGIADGTLGIKSYYRIVIAIGTFFVVAWFVYYDDKLDYTAILRFLLYFSLIIGFLRIAAFFRNFEIPFLHGVFRYYPNVTSEYGGITIRFAGLDIAGSCGCFSLLALKHSHKPPNNLTFTILFVIFCVFMILHAGRSMALGFVFALTYYLLFVERISLKKVVSGVVALILLIVALNMLPNKFLKGQINRIAALEGGIQGQMGHRRGIVFKTFVNDFYEHPVFGRGIRPVEIKHLNRNTSWIKQQLADGGHGSYHSLMGLFGIGGIFFIAIFMALSIIKIHFIINRRFLPHKEVYIFIMLFLLFKSLVYYAGGKGYNDYSFFLLIGLFVGINAKKFYVAKPTKKG